MTRRVLSTDTGRWKAVMANFAAAKEAVDAIEHVTDCEAADRVRELLDDVVQAVYSTAAPDLGALAEKLEVYWGEELFAQDD